ncbi:hypothetical protein [Flavobacterium sp. PL002]|uniref:hypothetical protein n=1 Tax=Flavobacterium sp. PL002 TaxID=1897058 RepID=UPI00178855F4|nr:hypothetical protein [Flavobacterium sp. PL002]MBE0391830.1 hypothetical protein [Flavobacterium sp. PL002]
MKIIPILVALSTISCNGQQEKKIIESTKHQIEAKKNNSKKLLDLTNLKFKTNINEVLSRIGLTLNNNALNEYNISGDYEEFKFTHFQIDLFENNIDSEKNETSFFYTKKDKLVWCYEINISDNDDALKIIKSFENKYGVKPAFSKISVSTKERPLFLDENGEFKKDKLEERILVWEDLKVKATFFLIYKVNYDKEPVEGSLQIIAIDKDNKKYKDWVSYRFLDMYYKN